MHQFCSNGRIDVPNAHNFFPAEIEFKKRELFAIQRSDGFSKPVSHIEFMLGRLQVIEFASQLLDLSQDSIGIEYLLQRCRFFLVFLRLVELALQFEFQADIALDGNLSSLDSQFNHLFIELEINQRFIIMLLVVQPVSVQAKSTNPYFRNLCFVSGRDSLAQK